MKLKYHIVTIYAILSFITVGFLEIYAVYERIVVKTLAVICVVHSVMFFAFATLAILDYIRMIKKAHAHSGEKE